MNYIKECLRSEAPVTPEVEARLIQQARAIHGIIGLMTECGELADQYKRHIFYGKPLDLTNLREELGDIDWYQCVLADTGGIEDILDCLRAVIAKLRKRFPDKFSEDKALNRDLDAERNALEQSERATSVSTLEQVYKFSVDPILKEIPGVCIVSDTYEVKAVSKSAAEHKLTVNLLYPFNQNQNREQRHRDYLAIRQGLVLLEVYDEQNT